MRHATLGVLFIAAIGCASAGARPAQRPAPAAGPAAPAPAQARGSDETSSIDRAQYPSTYQRHPNPPVLIRNATILTAAGLAIAGGITTIQALPGSANLIGGRSAILKLIPARTVQEMKFPGAHYGLKMAFGENPKRGDA